MPADPATPKDQDDPRIEQRLHEVLKLIMCPVAGTSHLVNHIPYCMSLVHIHSGKQLAPRIERLGTFGHDVGRQGDVSRFLPRLRQT